MALEIQVEAASKFTKKYFDVGFLLLPFNSLHPIRLYLSLATSVTIHRDRSILRKVLFLHILLLLNLLKTVYLSVYLPANPRDRIRLADYMYITTGEDFSYQIWILQQGLLLYSNYILLTVKPVILWFIESLLFNKAQPFLKGISQKSRSPLKNVRLSARWMVNSIGFLKIICDILLLIITVAIASEAIDHPSEFLANPLVSPLLFTWRVLQVTFGLAGFMLAIFLYATVFPNIAAVAGAIITLLFLRLGLNAKQLTAWRASSLGGIFTWAPLGRYRAYSMATFSLFFLANQLLGRLFAAFMAVNLPMSAFCLVYLALGGLNLKTVLNFQLIMSQGFIGTLGFHWFLARLTKRLHAPSKALLSLNALTSTRMGNFRSRLTLHLAICHLHTNRKYGFTYGTFGLVTMGSFSKCMILYSELILYAYKLIQDI